MTRIVEQTSSRVRLRTRPGPWLILVLWALLLAYLYGLCPYHRLTLTRTASGVADVRAVEQLFGIVLSKKVIPGVISAQIETSPGAGGQGWRRGASRVGGGVTVEYNDTSRIAFETRQGRHLLTKGYITGLAGHREVAEQINEFLRNAGPQSVTLDVPRSWVIWLGAGILAFGAVGVLFFSGTDSEVDRDRDEVTLRWKGFPGWRAATYQLSEVERFQVVTTVRHVRSGRRKRRTREVVEHSLGMRMLDGEEISLTRESSSWGIETMQNMADQLNRFRQGTRAG